MYKKFEINQTKIKGDCQSGRKEVTHNSKSDLPLGKRQKKIHYAYSSILSEEMRANIFTRIANGKIRLFFAKSVFGLPITVDICKSFAMKKSDYCIKTLTCILFHCHISMHFLEA